MNSQPGQTLSHYRLVKKIGEGGMGVVWKALDTKLDRHIALKLLPQELTADPERRRRFLREARTTAAVTHPNIVTIYEIDEVGGVTFIAMELVEGRSLRSVIGGHPIPVPEALRIATEIAEGLTRAHQERIVHRDLKPENVILGADDHARILDFGLAKLVEHQQEALRSQLSRDETRTEEMTREGKILGTPAYMSPEQARGEVVDERSDLFSFGVTLYEMVTGRPPFQGHSQIETLAAILHKPAVPASRMNPAVPSRLEDILGKLLEKDPKSRYQTSQDLVVDLRRLRRDLESGSPPSYEATQEVPTPKRRRRAWAFAAAGAVTIIIIGLAAWWAVRTFYPGTATTADARTILILPLEVRGQVEGADYAGQAFAEAVAMNLTQANDLTILPVPEPGELGERRGLHQTDAARKVQAGLMLTGALSREGKTVRARLSLVDAAKNRIVWGAEQDSPEGDLSQLAVILSRKLLSHFGGTGTRMYESHHSETPSPAVVATQEFVEARIGLHNITAPVQATGRLVERFPNDPLVRVMRADALLQAAWGAPAGSPKRRAFEESLADIDRVDRNNPWDDFFRAIYYRVHDGKQREAVEEYTRLLARDDIAPSGHAQILTFRGQAKADMDDLEGGIADLEEALRLTPAADFPHLVLSGMLAAQQRYEEAWALARQAVALNPTSHQNQYNLGWISLQMEKWGDALPALEKACQGTPSQWNCAGWAIALWRTGRQEEARRVAQQAASLPVTTWGAVYLGIYHAQAGNRSEALRYLHRYLEEEPTFTPGDARYLAEEPLLKPLHGDPDFEAIVAEARRRAQSQR